jgi:long-subunit fatty acid transport protein
MKWQFSPVLEGLLWVSAGATYALKPNMELGCAYTYGLYADRTIDHTDANLNGIAGEFSDTIFHSLSASFSYQF